jgi:hypothetical protein
MKKTTRIDIFTDITAYIAFMEWAKTRNPKTKADMLRLLAEYKEPDMIVDAHPEIVEHKITQSLKVARVKTPKEK